MIPSAVSAASVRLKHGYDQSGVAVAGVPARSPRPPWPTGPPESPELAEALLMGLLLWLLLGLPLRSRLLNSQSTSCHHDSPRWTTMTTLSLLNCCPLCRCKLRIYNDHTTASTSSLCTLCGLSDCCCSRCLCVGVLALLGCHLLRCLAFRSCRLARRGPPIVISWTTTNILCASHLI